MQLNINALPGIYSHIEPHPCHVCSMCIISLSCVVNCEQWREGGTRSFCFLYPPEQKVKTGSKENFFYVTFCLTQQWRESGRGGICTCETPGVTTPRNFWRICTNLSSTCFPLPAWCNTCCWLDGCTDPRPVAASPDPALLSSRVPPTTQSPSAPKSQPRLASVSHVQPHDQWLSNQII